MSAGSRIGLEAGIQDVTGNPWLDRLGWVGFALLPWYGFDRSAAPTLADYFVSGSALVHGLAGAWWLLPIVVPLCMAAGAALSGRAADANGTWLVASGLLGLALIVVQGFAIGLNGWTLDILTSLVRRARARARPAWATARR